jgi:hypothetical protein
MAQGPTAAAAPSGRSRSAGHAPGSAIGGKQRQQLVQQQQQQQRQQHRRDPYTDPEVQQRTAVWAKLMRDMQQSSDGAQFVYLRYAWLHQQPLNPFDLEVCCGCSTCHGHIRL